VKAPAKKSKTPAKAVVKPVVKTKAAPKPAAKAVKSKAAAKPAAKKIVGKAPVKTVAKAVVAKAAPKSTSAKGKAAAKAAPSKPPVAAKTTNRKTIKTPSKPVPKPPAKAAKPTPAVKAPVVAKQAKAPAVGKKTAPPPVVSTPIPVRTAEKNMLIPAPPALKPGRRSSARTHSQMPPPAPMVPTHAPDAAKASYSTMTERVIAPPPHVAAKKDPKLANNWKTKPAEELTDDEVKAMPDSEYMNEKQMAFFRHKLSILKQEIHNSAGETTEHLREDTVVVPDPADRATIEEEHALELRTRDRERKLLKKIEQSIARIDSGDYGYCDETGEPIGVGRLIARPTANLSLEAQQRRELKQKMFGD
jgi:DnaK suppressor protein